ncbi:MAG: hypothetical protein ACM3U2_22960, partial [Deltaproteobacteria bacterium]
MPWGTLWLAVAVLTADPDPAEFRLVGTGKFWCRSEAFSPDGEWIAALRLENPTPTRREGSSHIDLWRVADVDGFSGSAGGAPPPTVTTEIKGCSSPRWICFTRSGDVVVLAGETEKNGFAIRKKGGQTGVPAEEAQQAKAAGRAVSRFHRPLILFFDRDSLTESRRWRNDLPLC